jgi:hypothetical protein
VIRATRSLPGDYASSFVASGGRTAAQRVVVKQRPSTHPALPAVRRQQFPRRVLEPLAIRARRSARSASDSPRFVLAITTSSVSGPPGAGLCRPPAHPRTGAKLGPPGPAAGRRDRTLVRQALEEAWSRTQRLLRAQSMPKRLAPANARTLACPRARAVRRPPPLVRIFALDLVGRAGDGGVEHPGRTPRVARRDHRQRGRR